MAGAERPKVVYESGRGRSGSTILGLALGNCEGTWYCAGEMHLWLGRDGKSPMRGDRAERARFWARVAARGRGPRRTSRVREAGVT